MSKIETPPSHELNSKEDFNAVMSLLTDPEKSKAIKEIEKGYPYWDKFKHIAKAKNIDPELGWKLVKLQRQSKGNNLTISNIPGFGFKFSITANILKYLHEFDMNLGGVLEGSSIVPSEDKSRYLISSIMEEAIASSQIEGAATTREVAKDMLRTNRKPRNTSEKMIMNNYLTIRKILTLKDQPLTKDLILEIHSVISKDTLNKKEYEGKYRHNNEVNVVNFVTGEIVYTPPECKHVDELMTAFCNFANAKDDDFEGIFIHPIIRAIILHFLIGYIHPFIDGNGRTARAIFYWYLLSRGYWLLEYLSISRIIIKSTASYAKAYIYTETDENDLTYFIDYNLKSLDLALKSLKDYINRKIREKKELYNIIKSEHVNERQLEILRSLLNDSQKTITIREMASRFDVVYQTARADLLNLTQLDYLRQNQLGQKLIFYRSENFEQKLRKIANEK